LVDLRTSRVEVEVGYRRFFYLSRLVLVVHVDAGSTVSQRYPVGDSGRDPAEAGSRCCCCCLAWPFGAEKPVHTV
jgi:hypothetical protein